MFFDRDNTLNKDAGYTHTIEEYQLLPSVLSTLKRLEKTNFLKIIITNQSGIARGYYAVEHFDGFMTHMLNDFKGNGVTIDGVYHCAHLPDDSCNCRKPQPGMFFQAATDHGVDLSISWSVGNSHSDVVAGKRAGVRTIMLGASNTVDEEATPHHSVETLDAAVDIIMGTQ